jgi:hypothetical protein
MVGFIFYTVGSWRPLIIGAAAPIPSVGVVVVASFEI